jgi:hypothetical protein
VCVEGVALPDLGVYVDRDRLELDYRMGPGWDALRAGAFVRLLGALREHAPAARIWHCSGARSVDEAVPAFERAAMRRLAAARPPR